MVWLLGLTLLAVGLAIVFSLGDDEDPAAQTAFAETFGDPLAAYGTPDAAIGTMAPDVSAQALTGERVRLGGDDTARVYGFFAHWCPHCRAEVPVISQWLTNNDLPDGVEVVGVSTSVEPTADNYPPSEWFEREAWPTTVLLDSDDSAIARGYGLTSFPYWVAVDSDGLVVARTAGIIGAAELSALVELVNPAR